MEKVVCLLLRFPFFSSFVFCFGVLFSPQVCAFFLKMLMCHVVIGEQKIHVFCHIRIAVSLS
jgi:hypothetical protein